MTDYTNVRFDQVARQVKEKVDPVKDGVERYIAGEHLDSEDLKIRRWGEVGDGYLGPAFHRYFAAGQILFGSRRTYLRKCAVADFDGVCANTTFVIEAIPDRIYPPLLPFIMQSEPFVQHSILHSRGSTNPYVNWKDIAKYEFPLPPLDEQRRIAEILWAVEDAIEAFYTIADDLNDIRVGTFNKWFRGADQVELIKLEELLLETQYGISKRASSHNDGYMILRIPNVVDRRIVLDDIKWVKLSNSDLNRYSLQQDDILVVRTNGNPEYVGRCTVVGAEIPANTVFASYLIRLRVDSKKAQANYVSELLNSHIMRPKLLHDIRSSAGNYNINTKGIKRQKLPMLTDISNTIAN